jgi:N-methylhydantoinase A/oxoprolinase/acetone carboxylase beta subunit
VATAVRVGADIGGTFTDVTLLEAHGKLHRSKVLTTPHDPAQAVLQGLQQVVQAAQTDISQVDSIIHSTTLVINALIERLSPLVSPALRYPPPERLYRDGSAVKPLIPQAAQSLIATLHREHVQAVAVCVLHRYKNPQSEQRRRANSACSLPVSCLPMHAGTAW